MSQPPAGPVPGTTLSEHESKRRLAAIGVPIVEETLVADPEGAARAASALGFPVAVKLCGRSIAHKTERGLVKLGMRDEASVRASAAELLAAARPEDGAVELLVSRMVSGKRELIAGAATDPTFGPCVLFGNVMVKRYLGSAERLKDPTSEMELRKYREMAAYFRKYANQYDADWLLVIAQGYQESQLDQAKRSGAGAVGVMQIKPSTAADKNVGIENVDQLENNIHASVKYMRFLRDRYFADPALDRLDQGLFTLAAYNAGPARVAKLREKAKAVGLDPNQWFGNVEIIAAHDIGRETVDYVSNIYKYYTAYKAIAAQHAAQTPPAG